MPPSDQTPDGAPAPFTLATVRRQVLGRRSPMMWLLLSGVLVSCVVVVAFGAQAGSLTLAVFLAVVGVGRATIPPPGGRGLVVRSRAFDLFAYWSMAAAIAVLALVAPGM